MRDYPPHIPVPFTPRSFFDAALLLTVRIDTDTNGVEVCGTGFLVQVLDGDKMAIALVSNEHVFGDGTGDIELRFHAASSVKDEYQLGDTVKLKGSDFTEKYVRHPDPAIDLAAAIVNAMGPHGKGKLLSEQQIATAEELDNLSCGDEVFFVGYPSGWRDELHNLPLVRRGSVASLPLVGFDGRPEFVIDAQVFPGSSGSPVFSEFNGAMKLIGVIVKTQVHPSPVIGPPTVLGDFAVEEAIGLGIVIRGTEVVALLSDVRAKAAKIIASQSS